MERGWTKGYNARKGQMCFFRDLLRKVKGVKGKVENLYQMK